MIQYSIVESIKKGGKEWVGNGIRQKGSSTTEARVVTERWRNTLNQIGPHSSLGYRPQASATFCPLQLTNAWSDIPNHALAHKLRAGHFHFVTGSLVFSIALFERWGAWSPLVVRGIGLPHIASSQWARNHSETKNPFGFTPKGFFFSSCSGGGIRTHDLRIMIPTL